MMALGTKDNIIKDKSTVWAFICGKMDLNIKENGF